MRVLGWSLGLLVLTLAAAWATDPTPCGIGGSDGRMVRLASPAFPDVPSDHWAYPFVEACAGAGLVSGFPDGLYHPEYQVTRDQMAVYIARGLAGGEAHVPTPTAPAVASFTDVSADYWAFRHIEYAKYRHIVTGYPGGTYHPGEVVTRDQMAVYAARATVDPTGDEGLAGYHPPTGGLDPVRGTFADVPIDYWAWKYIEYCNAQGIAVGDRMGDYPVYLPLTPVTRDQMSVFVARAFGLAERADPTPMPDWPV